MKYDDLNKVNSEISYLPTEDGEYATVAERILAFRKVYPEGFIETNLTVDANGNNVFHTAIGYYTVVGEAQARVILGTGTAREKAYDSIDNVSPLERAETASVGRALGMAGFGIKGNVASFDELVFADIVKPAKSKPAPTKKTQVVQEPVPDPIDLSTPLKDESSGKAPGVPVAVVSEVIDSSSAVPIETATIIETPVDNTVKKATSRQISLITKYYSNKLGDFLNNLGFEKIEDLPYEIASEVIQNMVSGD